MRPFGVTSPRRTRAVPVNVRPDVGRAINTSERSRRRDRVRRRPAAPIRPARCKQRTVTPDSASRASPSSPITSHGDACEAGGRGLDDLVERLAVRGVLVRGGPWPTVSSSAWSKSIASTTWTAAAPRLTCAFMPVSRRTMVTSPSARSRGRPRAATARPSAPSRWPDGRTRGRRARRARRAHHRARSSSASFRAASPRSLLVLHQHDDALDRRKPRRHDEAVLVAVSHDQRAHQPRRRAPRRRPAQLLRAGVVRDTGCRRCGRSSGRARGSFPSAAPCRRASSLRTSSS